MPRGDLEDVLHVPAGLDHRVAGVAVHDEVVEGRAGGDVDARAALEDDGGGRAHARARVDHEQETVGSAGLHDDVARGGDAGAIELRIGIADGRRKSVERDGARLRTVPTVETVAVGEAAPDDDFARPADREDGVVTVDGQLAEFGGVALVEEQGSACRCWP